MTITVTDAHADDRGAWEALYRGYAAFYAVPMTDSTLETVWTWIHDPAQPLWCRLARDCGGTAVGLMHFRAMTSPLRGREIGFLDDLFVDPAARGSGAVDALFTDLEHQARARDWPSVRWITADDNYRARAVYDRIAHKTQWNTYQLDIGS
ncbi:MAG: GNAT family N-acetyltransferase [Pseudomonadota bacterium]